MLDKVFKPEGVRATNGVLAYFKQNNLLGTYTATFSTKVQDNYVPNNILDISNELFYASVETTDDKYVGFTFIEHSFNVENYTIRQYKGANIITKSWKLQGLRGTKWIDIDEQSSQSYCVTGILPTFQVKKTKYYFKTFRLLNVGVSCTGANYLRNAGIELFGTLKARSSLCNKCTSTSVCKSYLYIYFIILLLNI